MLRTLSARLDKYRDNLVHIKLTDLPKIEQDIFTETLYSAMLFIEDFKEVKNLEHLKHKHAKELTETQQKTNRLIGIMKDHTGRVTDLEKILDTLLYHHMDKILALSTNPFNRLTPEEVKYGQVDITWFAGKNDALYDSPNVWGALTNKQVRVHLDHARDEEDIVVEEYHKQAAKFLNNDYSEANVVKQFNKIVDKSGKLIEKYDYSKFWDAYNEHREGLDKKVEREFDRLTSIDAETGLFII